MPTCQKLNIEFFREIATVALNLLKHHRIFTSKVRSDRFESFVIGVEIYFLAPKLTPNSVNSRARVLCDLDYNIFAKSDFYLPAAICSSAVLIEAGIAKPGAGPSALLSA